jgi:hypothetical protein
MEYNFDVDAIVSIKLKPMYQTNYEWLPVKIVKNWFGLYTEVFEEGYYEYGSYRGFMDMKNSPRSKENIELYYVIKDDNTVWAAAEVTVYLTHDQQCSVSFLKDEEAKEWVEKLKTLSGKTFENVEYNN